MAEYLRVFEEAASSAPRHQLPGDLPLVVISAGDQPDDVKAAHQRLADSSSRGRHLVAAKSGHWVPFDQPEVIVNAIREIVGVAA
jgi:pimeloyl-ACP methyl ester carboxylesterase